MVPPAAVKRSTVPLQLSALKQIDCPLLPNSAAHLWHQQLRSRLDDPQSSKL